jgi:hypothetical protein
MRGGADMAWQAADLGPFLAALAAAHDDPARLRGVLLVFADALDDHHSFADRRADALADAERHRQWVDDGQRLVDAERDADEHFVNWRLGERHALKFWHGLGLVDAVA